MNTDNQPTPDDGYRKAWQQVFDDAAETPPPRVWNAVERQLDADNRTRIIPLWANVRPWATGLAASVTLILTGWWVWHTMLPASPVTLANKSASTRTETAAVVRNPEKRPTLVNAGPTLPTGKRDYNLPGQGIARQQNPTLATPARITVARVSEPAVISSADGSLPKSNFTNLPTVRSRVNEADGDFRAGVSTDRAPDLAAFGQPGAHTLSLLAQSASVSGEAPERIQVAADLLSSKSFRNRQLSIQRVVWFRNNEVAAEETVLTRAQKREKWVALSVMPSSFNPAVALQSQSVIPAASLANISYTAARTPSIHSESGRSVAMQVSAGAQLNDRWSVETGVGYLQAQSSVLSPAQLNGSLSDSKNPQTLYSAVVQNTVNRTTTGLSGNNDKNNAYPQTALYDTQTEGRTRNDYSFVQVPVQMGYQLRPRRKLGFSVIGGLLSNWFVRNSVGESLVVKPSDHVYREFTLASTAGARVRYRSSRHWSASVAGVYQQSLQLGTQTDAGLETRPHTVGVSFGMDYHF